MNQSVINNLAAKINSKEQKSNKVASWNSTPSDDKYPSEKLVKDSLDGKANSTHYHGGLQNNGQVGETAQSNKNVVTDGNGLITTEDKPTIPNASSTTPSADTTNGSVGNGTTWARSNHTHPKSSIYAESNHNHNIWDLNQTDNNSMTAFEFAQGGSGYDGDSDAYYVLGRLYYDTEQDSMYYDNGRGQGPYGYGEEIATIADIPNINGKENVSNKVTSLSSSSTDTQYPSAKLVKDSLDLKADKTTTLDTTNLSAYVENKFLILTDEEEEEMITIGCAIIWNDQNNSSRMRPLSVKCTLSDSSEYILSNINDWSITIQVPKYDASNEEIQYLWATAEISGYRLANTTVNNSITTFTLKKKSTPPT